MNDKALIKAEPLKLKLIKRISHETKAQLLRRKLNEYKKTHAEEIKADIERQFAEGSSPPQVEQCTVYAGDQG